MIGDKNVIKPPKLSGRNPTNKLQIPKNADLLIGGIRKPSRPSSWVRFKGNRPSWYSFDGIIDEVKIYNSLLQKGFRMDRGYGKLRGKAFRIAHMGNIFMKDLVEYLEIFEKER